MKRAFVLSGLILGLLAVAGCRKDQPEGSGPGKPETVEYLHADDAGVLQANLVITDEDDNLVGYVTGRGLNEADPGQVSILCETLEAARELFLSWMPEGSSVVETGEDLVWNMYGLMGESQGAAVLSPGGSQGAVAHLVLPAAFPVVTGVNFLPRRAMQENAELDFVDALDMYYFGNTINIFPSDFKDNKAPHGSGIFCIIREYDQDTNTTGILLSMPDYEHKVDAIYTSEWEEQVDVYLKKGRKLSELQGPIGKTYRQYRKYIDEQLKSYRQVNGDHWFAAVTDRGGPVLYNMVTDKSDSYSVTSWWGWLWAPDFYDCYAYYFTVEKDSTTGEYKVVYK